VLKGKIQQEKYTQPEEVSLELAESFVFYQVTARPDIPKNVRTHKARCHLENNITLK
jgi:hypothetical protein